MIVFLLPMSKYWMMRESTKLQKLYRTLYNHDILISNINEDFVAAFEDYGSLIMSQFVLEAFEKIVDRQQTNTGFHDSYSVELLSGLAFELNLYYHRGSSFKAVAAQSAIAATHKGNLDLAQNYKQLENMPEDKYVVHLEFKDKLGRHGRTNEVGIASFELFKLLKTAIIDSMVKDNFIYEVYGVTMFVDKNDPKRQHLYKLMLQKGLGTTFPNIFVDTIKHKEQGNDVLIASR